MATTPPSKSPPPNPTTPPSGDEPAPPVTPDGEQPAASGNGQGDQSISAEDLAAVLRAVVLVGVDHTTPNTVSALFGLRAVRDRAHDSTDDSLTAAAREVIRAALDSLGDGNYGRAARLLFGANADSRGQPARERRRLAADQIDVLPDWFRRRYEPQIAADVAAEILNIEHAPTDDQPDQPDQPDDDTGTAVAVISDDAPGTALEFTDDRRPPVRGRVHRVLTRVRHPLVGDLTAEGSPVVLATARPVPAVQSGQLVSVLQGLRDQQARHTWRLVWIAGGGVVAVRYGRDALPRYVFVLAALGFITTAVATFREWRATRSLALGERWPRLALYTAAVVLAAGFNVGQQGDPPTRTAGDCEWYERPCNDDPTTPTTEAHPSPNYVPPTHADPPTQASEPDCPPAASTGERRLAFTARPPMCINPDARYTATITTNYGHFTVTLNTQAAPWTVNNFVFLARWGFYNGVQLIPAPTPAEGEPLPTEVWSHLYSGSPTNPADPATGTTTTDPDGGTAVPGYTHAFEAHQGDYPDDDTLFLAITNPQQPDQFAIVVTPEGHNRAELGGAYALLGVIEPECRAVIAQRDGTGGWDVSPKSEAIVIEAITITEEPANTTTTRPPTTDDPCGRLAAARND